MKVRVAFTVDADDETRRLINRYYGYPGLASRQDIVEFYRQNGEDRGNMSLSDLPEAQGEGDES